MTTPLVPVFSKARLGGQWAAALLALSFAAVPPAAEGGAVPRHVALKAGPAIARGGPGDTYPALWRYTAAGLPLQVVAESGDWRRVCDPEGGLGWVRAGALDERRTVMRMLDRDLPLRARPSELSPVVAVLSARAVADLLESRGDWRRIAVDHVSGWVRADAVWGGTDAPQCAIAKPGAHR